MTKLKVFSFSVVLDQTRPQLVIFIRGDGDWGMITPGQKIYFNHKCTNHDGGLKNILVVLENAEPAVDMHDTSARIVQLILKSEGILSVVLSCVTYIGSRG